MNSAIIAFDFQLVVYLKIKMLKLLYFIVDLPYVFIAHNKNHLMQSELYMGTMHKCTCTSVPTIFIPSDVRR